MVELEPISKEKRELIVRDLVYHLLPIPSMKSQFSKGVFPSLNSSHFFINSFLLFPYQIFCSPSHSHISYSSTTCAKTHFDFKILFKNHLSQSDTLSVNWAGYHIFTTLKAHLHTYYFHIFCMVFMISLPFCLMIIAYLFLILVESSFGCCEPFTTLLISGQILFKRDEMMWPQQGL